ncbi:MFS transporter [Pedobacter frigiditerrae]|uniref:MFS transporter n=1 Tax=Pedobacter frigiditerrae TaxID=2530452 RepID=A0A4R0MPJ3_9SPHI|nr:MFS transporter [Pedobacter frigiditerrae]TCC88730.1 MFS transporter [Pedobacter frigiditerrae]
MIEEKEKTNLQHLLSIPVIVAALGYFVDIYDLLLFGIVRIPSLTEMGLNEEQRSAVGASILNWQMIGLLLGGILWGVVGDKKGRLSVLFGSIITYSIANIACGFVQDAEIYKILRFIAGIGLAGELGAGITLVSEILPKRLRAIGTSLVAGVGLCGAVVAYFTVALFDSWRTAYFIGGGLGISLLLLRVGVVESGMFDSIKHESKVAKGNFLAFFTNRRRFLLYIKCIAIGLPTWFVIGILSTFSNEFGVALGIAEPIIPGLAIMWCYIGLASGDLMSGFFSHALHSRKKAVALMMAFTLIGAVVYLSGIITTAFWLYAFCLWMGIGIGYWAMFVTISAEQFGTNLRATAATTVPNMVRGAVVLMTSLFGFAKPSVGVLLAGGIVGICAFILGFYAVWSIPETHDRDLDFLEH